MYYYHYNHPNSFTVPNTIKSYLFKKHKANNIIILLGLIKLYAIVLPTRRLNIVYNKLQLCGSSTKSTFKSDFFPIYFL